MRNQPVHISLGLLTVFVMLQSPAYSQDFDSDSAIDSVDNCPLIANTNQADQDSDNIGDVCDNCRDIANSDQRDTNGDGYGNRCDPDFNRHQAGMLRPVGK